MSISHRLRPFLIPAALAVMLAVPGITGPAHAAAGPCTVPELETETDVPDMEASFIRSRSKLADYEACLASEAEVMSALNPAGLHHIDRQRRAAIALRQTLDAWLKAQEQLRLSPLNF